MRRGCRQRIIKKRSNGKLGAKSLFGKLCHCRIEKTLTELYVTNCRFTGFEINISKRKGGYEVLRLGRFPDHMGYVIGQSRKSGQEIRSSSRSTTRFGVISWRKWYQLCSQSSRYIEERKQAILTQNVGYSRFKTIKCYLLSQYSF